MDGCKVKELKDFLSLGWVLVIGLINVKYGCDIMKEVIVDIVIYEIYELGCFLNLLGFIVVVVFLLGLLGIVIGMIKVFNVIVFEGVGNVVILVGGILEVFYIIVVGLVVVIFVLFFYCFFICCIDEIVVLME